MYPVGLKSDFLHKFITNDSTNYQELLLRIEIEIKSILTGTRE